MNILTVNTVVYDTDKIKTKQYISPTTGLEYKIISSNIETDEHGDIMENPHPKYRSIITTENPKEILAFAPPSTMKLDDFLVSCNLDATTAAKDELMVNELIEGTMVNLFYDKRNHSWEIATRSGVEGHNWFLRTEYGNAAPTTTQQTFREMFCDAIGTSDINGHFADYKPNYCYSFVLQHPNNHIVLPISHPMLYLVAIYEIMPPRDGEFQSVRFIPVGTFEYMRCSPENSVLNCVYQHTSRYSTVYVPMMIPDCEDIKEVSNHYAMGVMATHLKTGKQTPVVNANYEIIKKIRGNHPNMQYHFFQLQKTGKLSVFLDYFPNYAELFGTFNANYQQFITEVQQAYYNYYVKKDRTRMPKWLFLHVSRIHREIYIPTRRIIKRSVVADYFDNMTPSQLVYYLNNGGAVEEPVAATMDDADADVSDIIENM